MAVIRYDPVQRSGVGRIYSPSLEGQLELSFLDLIFDDLDSDAFKPIINFDPITYATTFERILWINAFVNVTAGFELYPFTSRPEPRFNFGSYSNILGYTSEEPAPGEFVFTAIADQPQNLLYKTLAIAPTWFQYSYPNPSKLDYEIKFTAPVENLEEIFFTSLRGAVDSSTSVAFLNVPIYQGILLNLNPGVVADFSMYYTWQNGEPVLEGETEVVSYYPL